MEKLSFSSVYEDLKNSNANYNNQSAKIENNPLIKKFISEKSQFLHQPVRFYTATSHSDAKIKNLSKKHNLNADEVARIVKQVDERANDGCYEEEIENEKKYFAFFLKYLASDTKYLSLLMKHKQTILYDCLELLQNSVETESLLQTITALVINSKQQNSDFVIKWLNYVYDQRDCILPITVINSLLLLGLNTAEATIDVFENQETAKEITEFLKTHNLECPLVYYFWTFVLYISDGEKEKKDIEYFIRKSDMVLEYMEQFELDTFYSTILSSFWKVALHFVTFDAAICKSIAKTLQKCSVQTVEDFLIYPEFETKLEVLRQKLPLFDEALMPLLYLASVNADFANYELRSCNTFATKVKLGELDYDLLDDEANIIVLKSEFLISPPLDSSVLLPIPQDTRAKYISTSTSDDEVLLILLYNFNGWSLLGRLLKSFASENLVALINMLTFNIDTPLERATEVLQQLSAFIEEDDIVAVIFEIFEKSLQVKNINVASSIVDFIKALLKNFPHLVWLHLVKSQLLDKNGTLLSMTSTELMYGDFKFLLSLNDLIDGLRNDAIKVETEVPAKTKEDIITKLLEYQINVFESYQFWKFEEPKDRFKLGSSLCKSFMRAQTYFSQTTISSRFSTSLINSILSAKSVEGDEVFKDFIESHMTLARNFVSFSEQIGAELINHSNDLAQIYMRFHEYKIPALSLMTAMVECTREEQLSILSHLEKGSSFVNALKYDLQYPVSNFAYMDHFYQFFGALLRNGQSGLCILFLTGEKASKSTQLKPSDNSLFFILKDQLLQDLPDEVFISLLKVVSLTLNIWNDKQNVFSQDAKVLDKLVQILQDFKPTDDFRKYDLIANVTETCAFLYYTTKHSAIDNLFSNENIPTIVKTIFDVEDAVPETESVTKSRFAQLFPEMPFTYDIPYLDKTLADNQEWLEFKPQLQKLVDGLKLRASKDHAAKTWGALLTSYVKNTGSPLNNNFLDLTLIFLQNDSSTLLAQRLELTFYIFYSFFKTKKNIPDDTLILIFTLLQSIFKNIEFPDSIHSSNIRPYYKTCLRLVLLTMNMVSDGNKFVETLYNELLKFMYSVIGTGTTLTLDKLLANVNKENEPYFVSEKIQDLLALLAIFNKIREMQPSESFKLALSNALSESGMLKSIINMYSNSHLPRNDPFILADVSLNFIVELCRMETVAEKLIANGLYAVLLESPSSLSIQKGGLTANTDAELYNLWLNGVLSVVLQLLGMFGSKVISETCLFVRYFEKQIKFCIHSWANYKNICVSTLSIQETGQIILLYKIMVMLEYDQYVEKVVLPGFHNENAKTELFTSFRQLLTHPKFLNSRLIATNESEQKILDSPESRSLFVKQVTADIKQLQNSIFSAEL